MPQQIFLFLLFFWIVFMTKLGVAIVILKTLHRKFQFEIIFKLEFTVFLFVLLGPHKATSVSSFILINLFIPGMRVLRLLVY